MATLQFRRGLYSALPTLAAGEPGFCIDTDQLFVGDGVTNHLIGPASGASGTDPIGNIFSDGVLQTVGTVVVGIGPMRAGTVTTSVLSGVTYTVTFSSAMPDTNYAISLSASFLSAQASWSSKTITGFTILLSAAVAGNVDWIVKEFQ